eukprot:Colp12_sorted_trinity150504_noHs@16774
MSLYRKSLPASQPVLVFLLAVLATTCTAAVTKVAVIGAGVSGLSAARVLSDYGGADWDVTVYEARDRSCGRVWTNKAALPGAKGGEVDMGASWIHSSGPTHPVTQLANALNVSRVQTLDSKLAVYDGSGNEVDDTASSTEYHDAFVDNVATVFRASSSDRSVRDTLLAYNNGEYASLVNTPIGRFTLASNIEFNTGAPTRLISSFYFDDDSKFPGEDEEVFPNGYSQICDGIISGTAGISGATQLKIQYGTTVSSVDYSDSVVTLATNKGAITADVVIVTVPLGVLKKASVAFNPPLPSAQLAAINRVGFGTVNKVVFTFPSVFWGTQHYFGLTTTNETTQGLFTYWLNAQAIFGVPGLMGIAIGEAAIIIDSMTEQQIKQAGVDQLKLLFGASQVPAPTNMVYSQWGADPMAYGSYSYAAVGQQPGDIALLATPLCAGQATGRVYFAGEHTSRKYRGTVHGALLSGRRVGYHLVTKQACADFVKDDYETYVTSAPIPTSNPTASPSNTGAATSSAHCSAALVTLIATLLLCLW